MLFSGISCWSQVNLGVSKNYEALRGTLQLGWFPSGTYPTQAFRIQIDLTRNRVYLEYLFTYLNSGRYVLQILLPFTLQQDLTTSPQSDQAWSFVNVHPYGSIVRVDYEGENSGEGYAGGYLTHLFVFNQTLFYCNRGTYSILLPLGADTQRAITDKMAELSPFVGITGGGAENAVEIVAPFTSVLVQAIPSDIVVNVPSNRTLLIFRWNLDTLFRRSL